MENRERGAAAETSRLSAAKEGGRALPPALCPSADGEQKETSSVEHLGKTGGCFLTLRKGVDEPRSLDGASGQGTEPTPEAGEFAPTMEPIDREQEWC